jgi:ATP-dependent Clp protease ATP-binding subunit ClpX
MDGITLSFEEDALFEIARQARQQKCGARGLRSILEKAMISIMYDAPDDPDITEIVVTEDVIRDGAEPRINRQPQVESA